MSKLGIPLTVTATFKDAGGRDLMRKQLEVISVGALAPLHRECVLLKWMVPLGARFDVHVNLGTQEALSFAGPVPVPHDYHDELSALFKKDQQSLFLVSFSPVEGRESLPQFSFNADIWCAVRAMKNGFTELELHVGKEGIGTPKWITKTQFWMRVE